MGKNRKKSSLTDAERKLILRMKIDLNARNVPKKEWASMIQAEINRQRKISHKKGSSESQKGIRKIFSNFSKKIKRTVIKIFTKRYMKNMPGSEGIPDGMMDQMLDMMTGNNSNPEEMLNQFLPNYMDLAAKPPQTPPRKKMDVVFFDDEDEDTGDDEDQYDDDDDDLYD